MDLYVIFIVGLPVLYVTGSLKKTVKNTGASGVAFVLYFLLTMLLTIMPDIPISQGISIYAAGTFFCTSPIIYLAVKRKLYFSHVIAMIVVALISVASAFLVNAYTMTYLPFLIGGGVCIIALLCCKSRASLTAPALVGIFSAVQSGMTLLVSGYSNAVFFDCLSLAAASAAVCLFAAYILKKPSGRHAARRSGNDENKATT